MPARRKKPLPPWLSGVTVTKSGSQDTDLQEHEVKTDVQESEVISKKKQKLEQSVENDQVNTSKGIEKRTETVSKDITEEKISVEKLVEMSYDEYKFPGSLIYCHNKDDCNIICDEIITSLESDKDHYVGFDTEWPVTYQKGKQAPTALIQLCLDLNKCYLFHISCMPKLPQMLKKLIQMDNVKKVGLNVENDLWKLEMDFDLNAKNVIQKSTVELRTLANQKLRSAENWSLEGLTKNVLRLRISKDPKIRTCDWSQYPLPEDQQRYAATDAVISLMLYKKLCGV